MTVVGPAGIGKSRLAHELIGAIGADATVLVGACPSYGDGVTYRPLAEIVTQLGGRERVTALLDADFARMVLAAVGLDDGAAQAEETFWAVRRMLEAVAAERPLVVVVEDIHWAEPTLLDLLEYLVVFSTGPADPGRLPHAPGAGRVAARVDGAAAGPVGARARRAVGRRGARARRHAGGGPRAAGGSWRPARATRCSSSSSSRSAATRTRCRRRSRRCWPRASTVSSRPSARCSPRVGAGPGVRHRRAGRAAPRGRSRRHRDAPRRARAQAADPRRPLRPARPRCLRVRPRADPRGRLPQPAQAAAGRAARAARALDGVAPERRRRDRRLPPRRGAPRTAPSSASPASVCRRWRGRPRSGWPPPPTRRSCAATTPPARGCSSASPRCWRVTTRRAASCCRCSARRCSKPAGWPTPTRVLDEAIAAAPEPRLLARAQIERELVRLETGIGRAGDGARVR